jgi:stress response protein YsnF
VETVDVDAMTTEQLRARAETLGVHGAADLSRAELVKELTDSDDAMTRSEEQLVVGTTLWETGRARLRKYVITEEVQITVPIRREELRLERETIPDGAESLVVDPDVFGPDEVFGGGHGGVIFEVTLHQERPVVTTEIVPVERVRLSKIVHTDHQIIAGEVRKERIDVDLPGQGPTTLE